ncbi:MAG TPA: OsmC family protein [Candidatus Acidoferrales bacterium]|nr:OsmC family protein [Candidatus Acidoferrales bacterium]
MQTARVRWVQNLQFLATTPSGHAVPFDSGRDGKSAAGAMEMLLAALGACTATDVVAILEKKRQKPAFLEVLVSGERAEAEPKVWTKIEMVYRLGGDLEEKAVSDAIELSQAKYCSVAAMLGKAVPITYRHEILP